MGAMSLNDERELVPVWVVWEAGELHGERTLSLRGIATTEERGARMEGQVKSFPIGNQKRVWVEKVALDHLFGQDDLMEAIRQAERVEQYKLRMEREGD